MRRFRKNPPITHTHRWIATNPFQTEAERCEECHMYRYEVMGPFARRAARLRAYERIGEKLVE